MNEDKLLLINQEIEDLIKQIGIEATVKLAIDNDTEGEVLNIQLESVEAASLIGFHGETLQALQLIFSFLCHKKLGQWVKVIVDIGDYRQKREDQLKTLVLSLAMKVKFSGETQVIPRLSASERRFVHLFLADNPDVCSESEGEGSQRTLMIKPRA